MSRVPVALKGDRDIDLERKSGGGGVEPGRYATDDPRLLETAHAMQGGRGREANQAGELHVRSVCVDLQLVQQAHINQIKRKSHFAKYLIVSEAKCQIELEF